MIHTAKQLKDKVKNMSGGNSEVAQALSRECAGSVHINSLKSITVKKSPSER